MVLLGEFNAGVGTASEIDEVIGMFGEETSNNNGEKLVSFSTEVDIVSCNGRIFVTELERTRICPGFKQKSMEEIVLFLHLVLRPTKDQNCFLILSKSWFALFTILFYMSSFFSITNC